MFGFDEEVPAGYQDADLEMAELERAGNEAARAAERRPNVATTIDYYAGAIKLKKEQWQPAVFAEGQDEPVQTAQAVRTKKEAESLAINLLDAVQAAGKPKRNAQPAQVQAPTPLTADQVEAMEARGETIFRTRSGEAFATRMERRAFRKAQG